MDQAPVWAFSPMSISSLFSENRLTAFQVDNIFARLLAQREYLYDHEIRRIPTQTWRTHKPRKGRKQKKIEPAQPAVENEEESCSICIEQYRDKERLRVLCCRHRFHKNCLDPWLRQQNLCPLCKSPALAK